MPTVPVVTERDVPVRKVKDERIDVSVNPGQFGSGVAQGLTSLGQNLAKMQAEDDAAAATDSFNKASEDARKYLYEGEESVYSRQGKNAVGAHDTSKKFFEETYSRYADGLENEKQKKAFKSLWDRRTGTNLDNVARHEASQRKVYFEQTQQANLQSNISHAANNYDKPDEVQSALINADTIIRSNPAGNSEEVILEKQAVARSEIHKSVIDRMMINDPDGAREYYNDNKDQVNGAHHEQIESGLKGNKQKQQSQIAADKIMQSNKTDAEKRSAAKKIKNPDVRALTEALVNQDISRRKTDRIESERQMNEAFWNYFIDDPDINKIPTNLPSDTKLKAIKFASSGEDRKTDLKIWNDLNQVAMNDPDKFSKMDLYNHVTDLDESDFQAFGKLQRTINKGDKTAYNHLRTPYAKMKSSLKGIANEGTDDFALFQKVMQQELIELNEREDRKAKPGEVDEIIDRLLIEGTIPGTGIFGTDYFAGARLFEAEEGQEFIVEEVPDIEREKIIDAYKRVGKVPTEEEIVGLYTKKVTKR